MAGVASRIADQAGCSEQHVYNTIGSIKRAGDGEKRLMRQDRRRVLIYRRTHVGDPCECGIFGVHNCMKSRRSWRYDAVIGVGGVGQMAESEGIARRLTWAGISPHRRLPLARCPVVTFDHFCLMDGQGPWLSECAPLLARNMFEEGGIPRSAMSDSRPPAIQDEIDALICRHMSCPPSRFTTCQCQRKTRRSSC